MNNTKNGASASAQPNVKQSNGQQELETELSYLIHPMLETGVVQEVVLVLDPLGAELATTLDDGTETHELDNNGHWLCFRIGREQLPPIPNDYKGIRPVMIGG